MVADLEEANLVQVQLLIPGSAASGIEAWEPVGIMKKKEFFKMIKPHKPKKRTPSPASPHASFKDGFKET